MFFDLLMVVLYGYVRLGLDRLMDVYVNWTGFGWLGLFGLGGLSGCKLRQGYVALTGLSDFRLEVGVCKDGAGSEF